MTADEKIELLMQDIRGMIPVGDGWLFRQIARILVRKGWVRSSAEPPRCPYCKC